MHELGRVALAFLICGGLSACGGVTQSDEATHDGAVLYLNFEGALLEYGAHNDAALSVTTLGDGPGPYQAQRAELARFMDGDAPTRALVIEQVVRSVRGIYAPFALDVVSQRPQQGEFTMVVVGNTFGEIQFADACPLAGLAVRDCQGDSLGDVGFVAAGCMPADWSPAQARSYLARTIAHEAGHTFGLSHNANQASLMSQASTGFSLEKGPVPIEDQASCQRTTQDDFAVLRQVLGLRGER